MGESVCLLINTDPGRTVHSGGVAQPVFQYGSGHVSMKRIEPYTLNPSTLLLQGTVGPWAWFYDPDIS